MSLFNDLRSKRQGYVPVAMIPSDSNSDEDDVFIVTSNNTHPIGKPDRQRNQPIEDEGINLREIPLEPQTNGGLNITIQKPDLKGKQPCASCCLTMASLVIFAIIIGFLLQGQLDDSTPEGDSPVNQSFSSDVVWESSGPYASESVVRLEDLNDDGILDVLHTLARTTLPIENFCRSIDMDEPCLGAVQAVDGRNGDLLWQTNLDSDIFAINCGQGKLDIDGDGQNDCLLAGRGGQLLTINSRTGKVLWTADKFYSNYNWNFYQPQLVPDLDGDGVNEVVVAHGGNFKYSNKVLDREAGRIILLSGKTGLSLGRYLNMSDSQETYSAITTYKRPNGAIYILFGSGGETIQGSLWSISLRDLYCYVTETTPDELKDYLLFLASDCYKEPWGSHLQTHDGGVIEILRSGGARGVIVPTILADMNNDGINDLIVSLFNGTFTVLDGHDLTMIWTTGQRFHGYQSYSNPAPGYFNDDDHLDIMVCVSYGTWPMYQQNTVAILDGRDGSTLWSTTGLSHQKMMSSPFSVQQSAQKSAFIFWLIGRRLTMQQTCFIDVNYANCTTLHDDDHKKRHADPTSRKCGDDALQFAEAELLMIDRDSMRAPAVISRVEAGTYHYELTNQTSDKAAESDQPLSGAPETTANTPRDRRTMNLDDHIKKTAAKMDTIKKYVRQKHETETADGSQCSPVNLQLIPTGAINDLDLDGNLDLINIYSRGTTILDREHTTIRSNLTIQRLKLRTHNLDHFRVPLHKNLTTLKSEDCGKCDGKSSMILLNDGWLGYMGLSGDGIYDVGRKN